MIICIFCFVFDTFSRIYPNKRFQKNNFMTSKEIAQQTQVNINKSHKFFPL